MNSKTRIKNTLKGKPVDRVPYSFDITDYNMERISAFLSIPAGQIKEHFNEDICYTPIFKHTETVSGPDLSAHYFRSEWGSVYKESPSTHYIGNHAPLIIPALKEPSLSGYHFPSAHAYDRYSQWKDGAGLNGDRYFMSTVLRGMFDAACEIRGFENILMDFALDPKFVHDLLDGILEVNLGCVEQLPDFIDGVRVGEDWGQQKGLFMGPAYWRTFLKPRLAILYDAIRKKGKNVFIHSCGDISEIFPDLIEIGVECVHPVQYETMDVFQIKKEYGEYITLHSCLSCQKTLPLGTVDEVLTHSQMIYNAMKPGGRYIFGTSGISADTPLENILAILEFAKSGYTI